MRVDYPSNEISQAEDEVVFYTAIWENECRDTCLVECKGVF